MHKKSIVFDTINQDNPSSREHIVVLMGGLSAEKEVSLTSAKGVVAHLEKLNYKVTPVDMGRDVAVILDQLKPDIVYNCLHGTYGEDGAISGLLEIMGVPYTHSGILASSIGMNKLISYNVFTHAGLKCAKGITVHKNQNIKSDPIARPYVVKPISEGSSLGIEIVLEKDNFMFSDYPFEYGDEVIVEEYIPGREIQVAVVNGKAMGVMEIIPKGKFYDYVAKYTDNMATHVMPAQIGENAIKEALRLSEIAYKALGCNGIARVEFRYNDLNTKQGDVGEFYILEVNTHPGMTPLSIVPEIVAYYGISYTDLVELVVEDARQRHKQVK